MTSTDKDTITSLIRDMASVDNGVPGGRQHMHESCLFVRPSGNPLTPKQWDEMMNRDDVSITSSILLSINRLEIIGEMAFACYITHGTFSYKGTENDDIAVLTSIFRKFGDVWKIVHGQRSTGRSPSDPLPEF